MAEHPDWFTPAQRAAAERGTADARAACGGIADVTTISVTLDRGGGLDGRIHIGWCLLCQRPTERCACGHEADPADYLVEDAIDAMVSVATVIAGARHQLELAAAALPDLVDVDTGDYL